MYITFDTQHQSVVREIRCPLCGVVVSSLTALGPEVDRTIETVGDKTIVRLYYLAGLVQTAHAGSGRTVTFAGNIAVHIPVCRQCETKSLSQRELQTVLAEVVETEDAMAVRGGGASLSPTVLAELRRELRAMGDVGVEREA